MFNQIAPYENLTWFSIRQSYTKSFCSLDSNVFIKNGELFASAFPETLSNLTKNGHSLDKLLSEHTVFPTLQVTSLCILKLTLFKHSMSMQRRQNVLNLISSDSRNAQLKYCPKCFIEQVNEFGFNWIVRDWSLPLVTTCKVHNTLLVGHECECNIDVRTTKQKVAGIFMGRCIKCANNLWPQDTKRATIKQRRVCEWMTNFASLEPVYISIAMHRTIVHEVKKKAGVMSGKNDDVAYVILRHYFPFYGKWGKEYLLKELKKWICSSFPIDANVFFSVMIKLFQTAEDFADFLSISGETLYLDNYELNKKNNITENYTFFEGMNVFTHNPDDFGSGRYLKVLA